MKSASYVKACCKSSECYRLGWDDTEPCWGEVDCVGEDYYEDEDGGVSYWIHGCQGHQEYPCNDYVAENV